MKVSLLDSGDTSVSQSAWRPDRHAGGARQPINRSKILFLLWSSVENSNFFPRPSNQPLTARKQHVIMTTSHTNRLLLNLIN